MDFNNRSSGNLRGIDFCFSLISCALLASLLVPALAASRASDDRTVCLNNARQIMQGLLQHNDTTNSFPLASTQLITAKPGNADAVVDSAGYSWLVKILPYINENEYYNKLDESSDNFRKPLFDPAVTSAAANGELPSRTHSVAVYMCPTTVTQQRERTKSGKTSRGSSEAGPPAISNYHVLPGTHFYNKEGIGRLVPLERVGKLADGRVVPFGSYEGNSAMPFPGYSGDKITKRGHGFRSISDGTSNTLMFAETIERQFAAWMDGQVTWVVAAWPGNPDVPSMSVPFSPNSSDMNLGWPKEQLPNNWTSMGKHDADEADSPSIYLPADRWSAGKDRSWGPSSDHEGMVTHGYVDGRAKMLHADMDKNVYLHLITRNGREIIPEEFTAWQKDNILIIRDGPPDAALQRTDKSEEFTYFLPLGWKVVDAPNFPHDTILLPRREAMNRNIIINDQPGESSFEELKELYERDLPKAVKDFKLVTSEIVELPNKQKIVKIIHTNSQPGISVRQVNYIIEIDTERYYIVCTVLETDGDKYDEQFEKFVSSIAAPKKTPPGE